MSERSFRRDYQRRLSATRRRHELKARKAAAAAAAVGAFALAAPASSSAANFVVTDPGDSGANTLRQAVLDANANAEDDTITFDASITGTITLTSGPLVVDSASSDGLTITGPGAGTLAISGNGASNVFHAERTGYDPGLTISGLTLTDGNGSYAGAVLTEKYSDVTLQNDVVTASSASGDVDNSGPFDVYLAGGGISNRGTMTITNSSVSGNDSTTNPGGRPYDYGGGGIDNVGRLAIDASTITGNTSDGFGGGIFQGESKYPSELDVSNSTITNNDATYAGGGIASFNKPVYGSSKNSVINTTIAGNGAFYGGGFAGKYVSGPEQWTISHSTFANNDAYAGGGIHLGIVTGSFNLVDSTVSGNTAVYGGGVNMFENAAKYKDATQFNNSTIASNHAYAYGGGIYLGNGPSYGPGGPPTLFPVPLFSTIVADNSTDGPNNDLGVDDPSTEGFDLSFSLVEAPGNATISQTPSGSSILGVDPQLGPLGDNGGPTLTQLPAVTSPVVDQGSAPGNLTTDQRGDPRTVDTGPGNVSDGTDIGAVELPAAPAPPAGGAAGTKVHGIKKKHKKRKHVLRTKHASVKVHVTFSSGTPGVTFKCSVDGGPAVSCTSPFSPSVSSAPGKGKVHTVTITASDSAGNAVGKPRTVRFRIIRED